MSAAPDGEEIFLLNQHSSTQAVLLEQDSSFTEGFCELEFSSPLEISHWRCDQSDYGRKPIIDDQYETANNDVQLLNQAVRMSDDPLLGFSQTYISLQPDNFLRSYSSLQTNSLPQYDV